MRDFLIIDEVVEEFYVVIHYLIDYGPKKIKKIKVAHTFDGVEIGIEKEAKTLVEKHGITKFEKINEDHSFYGLGYSSNKKKWFSWSSYENPIKGFGIGHKVKINDRAYFPKNKKEFQEPPLLDKCYSNCIYPYIYVFSTLNNT